MDEAVSSFLAEYPELEYRDERGGIVHCTLSGHEMPCRLEVVQNYVRGRRFLTLKDNADFDFHSLQPRIVPSKHRKYQLFCALTNRYINKKPEQVRAHLSGKKYKRALDRYKNGQQQLFSEKGKKGKASAEDDGRALQLGVRLEESEDHGGEFWVPPGEVESQESEMETESTGRGMEEDRAGGEEGGEVEEHSPLKLEGQEEEEEESKAVLTRKRKRRDREVKGKKLLKRSLPRPRSGVKSRKNVKMTL